MPASALPGLAVSCPLDYLGSLLASPNHAVHTNLTKLAALTRKFCHRDVAPNATPKQTATPQGESGI